VQRVDRVVQRAFIIDMVVKVSCEATIELSAVVRTRDGFPALVQWEFIGFFKSALGARIAERDVALVLLGRVSHDMNHVVLGIFEQNAVYFVDRFLKAFPDAIGCVVEYGIVHVLAEWLNRETCTVCVADNIASFLLSLVVIHPTLDEPMVSVSLARIPPAEVTETKVMAIKPTALADKIQVVSFELRHRHMSRLAMLPVQRLAETGVKAAVLGQLRGILEAYVAADPTLIA